MRHKEGIRIGTRMSPLALWQAEWVKARILALHPELEVTLVKIKTQGDRLLNAPLSRFGGKGLFVKELEEALLSRRVDLAVHSIKDLPVVLPAGLNLVAVPEREDPRDVFISPHPGLLRDLPPRARVGTGSLRRTALLASRRPDIEVVPLRGNVGTRLEKVTGLKLDGVMLAAAGIKRLGWEHRISEYLDPEDYVPAIGQGALGVEARKDAKEINKLARGLNHDPSEMAVKAERAFLARLEGGCQIPIAGHAVISSGRLRLLGLVGGLDAQKELRAEETGATEAAEIIGETLAETLLAQGADRLLAAWRKKL